MKLETVETAVSNILGKDTVNIYIQQGFHLPRQLKFAMEKCFLEKLTGPDVEIIREAVKALDAGEHFEL